MLTQSKSHGQCPIAALLSLMIAVPALAHHSFAAFDMTRTVTLAGTVKEFDWFNPHTAIVVLASDNMGKLKEYRFEGAPPAVLLGSGWTKGTLHFGDHISVEYHPRKDGGRGGTYIAVTLPNGKHLEARGAFFFGANSPESTPGATAEPDKVASPKSAGEGKSP